MHPLLERSLERDLLLTLAAEVAEGRSRLAVVTGEAGVGKSRLCREVVEHLPEDWPVSVHHRTGPVVPERGPAAVIVEDLHDAEPDTTEQLRDLLESGPPVLVLCTHRLGASAGAESGRRAFSLLRTPGAVEVRLAPLSDEATVELARLLGASMDGDEARRLCERTGGNPYFIEELMRSRSAGVPWTVTASVMDRVGSLDDSARTAIEALAVSGIGLHPSVLERLAPNDRSATSLLVERELASVVDGQARLRHDIVGEVVASQLGTERTRQLHRSLAEALLAEPVPELHRVVDHLVAAGDRRRAAELALEAAEHAVGERLFARATEMFRIVFEDGDVDHPARALEQAAVAAAQAGRTELAERWAHRADARYRADGDVHRATALWLDQALAYIRRPLLDLTDLSPDAASRLANDATSAARQGDRCEALELAPHAIAVATEQADSDAGGVAALALLLAGRPDQAVTALDALRRAAMAADDPVHEARRSFDLARCAGAVGDQIEAEAQQRAGLAALGRLPESGEHSLLLGGLAAILATSGDIEGAEAAAEPLLHHPNLAVQTVARLPMVMVDLARGRLDRARPWLAEIAPYRSIAGPDMFGIVLAQEALLHLRAGALARAQTVLDDAEAWIGGVFDISRPDRIEIALRIAVLRSDAATISRLAEETERLTAQAAVGPGVRGLAELAAGFSARARGRMALALVHLESAARHLVDAPRAVQAADAWCDAALAALAAGDHGRAGAALDEAMAIAEPRRLVPVLDRIGTITGLLLCAPASDGDLARLTPRDRSVIALVAEGLTNKEIAAALNLSDKTVRNQLSLLFAKLGIERRAQAAAFAVRHGLIADPAETVT